MATIDLGKIKLVWRGTYNNGTAYAVDDVVEYADSGVTSSYICTTASTGNAPSSGGTAHGSWAYMAKGQAVSPTTTAGDIIYRGTSADQRLGKGTAGQVLKMNSGATAPEWGQGAKVVKHSQVTNNTRTSLSSAVTRNTIWQLTFTKDYADSKLLINLILPLGGSGQTHPHFATTFIRFSTTSQDNDGSDIFGYIHNTRATTNNMGAMLLGNWLYDTTGTNISAAGTIYVHIGYDSQNNSSNIQPAPIWNPNASEDNRGNQSISNFLVQEII